MHLKNLDRTNIVIIPEVGSPAPLYPQFPFAKVQAELLEETFAIDGDQRFRQVASIYHGKDSHVQIYVRRSSFD